MATRETDGAWLMARDWWRETDGAWLMARDWWRVTDGAFTKPEEKERLLAV